MRLISNICRTVCAMSLLFVVGCVDENYRIDQVDTEVTIASGTTTLPLGSLDRTTLNDFLNDTEGLDTLLTEKDGRYVLGISDNGVYNVGGIEHVVKIPEVSGNFEVDYPKFGLTDHVQKVNEYFDVTPDLGDLSVVSGVPVLVEAGHTITGVKDGDLIEEFSYEVPEMLSGVKRIYLKPTEEGDPGARINVRFLLNDLASVNGGGHVTLKLKAPKGCNLYDGNGNHVEDGEFAVTEFDFGTDDNELPFLAYVESVGNDKPIEDGAINFSIDLEYHISFEMTTKEGSLTLNQGPQLHVMSDLAYGDADIVLNEVALLDHMKPDEDEANVTIKDLPEEINSIRSITFAEESPLVLKAGGFDWMSEDLANKIIIDAWLPEYIILHENVEIGYNAEEHKLHTTLENLRNGVGVDLDALDFGEEGLVLRNGTVEISFAPEIDARIEGGTEIKLSSIMHEGKMTLSAGIEEATLDIQEVSGCIKYDYGYDKSFKLGDIGNLNIDGVGLEPVLRLELENPFTLDLMASYSVVPYVDGKIQADRAINTNGYNGVGYVTIPAATVVGGVVNPTKSVIVLGTEASRDEYNSDCIFVPCDIEKLFKGEFPDELAVRLNIKNDPDPTKVVTLHTAHKYELKYTYSLEMPVELNNRTKLSYQQTIDFTEEGGENPFEQLADLPEIKLGDVAVIADVTTTLSLQLSAFVEMLDSDGEVIDGLVVLPESGNTIVGSKDGVTAATSTLRLELHLDNKSITTLANVAAIRFSLEAAGVDESSAPIDFEQYVEAALKLELSGGITADLKELGNM